MALSADWGTLLLHEEGSEKEYGGHQWMIILSADGRDHSYSIMHDQEGNFVATILSAIFWTRIKIGLRPCIKLSAFFIIRSVQLRYNFIKRPQKEYGPTTGLQC
jgi:hypothetical protein